MVQAIKRDEVYIDPEGIYVETQQPERRSRKPPLLLVHGALTGSWLWSSFGAYFAERGWEAHAMNLRGHYTSDLAELGETRMRDYAADIGVAIRQLGRPPIVIGWGIGALAAMLYAEHNRVLGLVLLAPSLLAALVVTQAVGGKETIVLDGRLVGVGTAIVAVRLRAPLIVAIVAAALATALARALFG